MRQTEVTLNATHPAHVPVSTEVRYNNDRLSILQQTRFRWMGRSSKKTQNTHAIFFWHLEVSSPCIVAVVYRYVLQDSLITWMTFSGFSLVILHIGSLLCSLEKERNLNYFKATKIQRFHGPCVMLLTIENESSVRSQMQSMFYLCSRDNQHDSADIIYSYAVDKR